MWPWDRHLSINKSALPGSSDACLEQDFSGGKCEKYLLRVEIAHVHLAPRGRRLSLVNTSENSYVNINVENLKEDSKS